MANEILVRVLERKRKYIWPEAQLNFWLIVMIASAATIVGVFTYFLQLNSVFHLGNPPWYAFPLPSPTYQPTNQAKEIQQEANTPSQDLPLQHSDRLPLPPLPPHHPRANPTTPTPPRHRRPGLLHPLRPLPDRPHRNLHPALRPHGVRQLVLQPLPAQQRRRQRAGDARLAGDAGHLPGLEGGVFVLHHRDGVFALDDGHGVSGQPGQF